MKPMMVLAGGFGTRLKSVLNDNPKPLAPVQEKTFIIHLLEHWIEKGVTKFIFLLHYKSEAISKTLLKFLKDCDNNIAIDLIVEPKPLGTGGSILNAINELNINYSFIVTNADTWVGDGFKKLSESKPNSLLSVQVGDTNRYGSLILDGKLVKEFKEKSRSNGPGYISSGLYHLEPSIFKSFSRGTFFSLEEEIFPVLASKKRLTALKQKTSFIDIGIPSDYNRFCEWIINNKETEL
tara:strand:+ start:1651 stop:2361 length:711 start_codon:yes stop_codon:yes gene_type:complete